jgi:hypothetical protein
MSPASGMASRAALTQNPDMNPAEKPARSMRAAESASCAQGVWMMPGSARRSRRFFAATFTFRFWGQRLRGTSAEEAHTTQPRARAAESRRRCRPWAPHGIPDKRSRNDGNRALGADPAEFGAAREGAAIADVPAQAMEEIGSLGAFVRARDSTRGVLWRITCYF